MQFYDSVRIKPATQRVRVRLSFPNAGLKVADRVVTVEVVK